MHQQINEEKLIAIFVNVDDFVNLFEQWLAQRALTPTSQPTRQTDLSTSELITLVVYYHHSGYKNFDGAARAVLLPTFSANEHETLLSPFSQLSATDRLVTPLGHRVACAE